MTRLFDWLKQQLISIWQSTNNILKVLITLIGVLAGLAAVITFLLQFPSLWRDFNKKEATKITKKVVGMSPCQAVFKDTSKYRIIILPFFKNCETGRDVGLEILNRLEKLKTVDSLNIELCYLYNFKPEPNFTQEQANEILKKNHANQVIYGINSSINCSSQDTLLEVCVKAITDLKVLNNQLVSVDQVVASVSQIRHGFLQTDIDNIIYTYSALIDDNEGRYEQSLKKLYKIRAPFRNSTHYTIKASLFNKLNKKDSALANYNTAIKLEPTAANYYDRGVFYRRSVGDNFTAIKDFIKAYEITSDVYQAHGILFELCLTMHFLGEYSQSTEWANHYISFIKKYKDSNLYNKHDLAIIYYFKGKNLFYENKENQAIALYDSSISINPKDLETFRAKADLLRSKYELSEALKIYNNIIKKDSNSYRFYADRGEIYDMMGNDSLSKRDFITTLKKDKYSAGAYQLLGIKMRSLKHYWLSLKMLNIARDKDLNDATTYFQLAATYDALNLKREAIKYYNKSLSVNVDPLYLYSLAVAYYDVGDYKNAIDKFSFYIKLFKQSSYKAYYYRALCKMMISDKTAMEDMNKANSMGMSLAKDFLDVKNNKSYFK